MAGMDGLMETDAHFCGWSSPMEPQRHPSMDTNLCTWHQLVTIKNHNNKPVCTVSILQMQKDNSGLSHLPLLIFYLTTTHTHKQNRTEATLTATTRERKIYKHPLSRYFCNSPTAPSESVFIAAHSSTHK